MCACVTVAVCCATAVQVTQSSGSEIFRLVTSSNETSSCKLKGKVHACELRVISACQTVILKRPEEVELSSISPEKSKD